MIRYLLILTLGLLVSPLAADTPTRLAPRPIPGMSAPSPAPIQPAAKKPIPTSRTAPKVVKSGAAQILFIHRRGTFKLAPRTGIQARAPQATSTVNTPKTTTSTPLAEGKIRIIPHSPLRN